MTFSLEPRLLVPDFLLQPKPQGKIWNGKPGFKVTRVEQGEAREWQNRKKRERKESRGEGKEKQGRKETMGEGNKCERSTTSIALFPGLPSPFLHTASNQKLKLGKTWEQGYHACKKRESGEGGSKEWERSCTSMVRCTRRRQRHFRRLCSLQPINQLLQRSRVIINARTKEGPIVSRDHVAHPHTLLTLCPPILVDEGENVLVLITSNIELTLAVPGADIFLGYHGNQSLAVL